MPTLVTSCPAPFAPAPALLPAPAAAAAAATDLPAGASGISTALLADSAHPDGLHIQTPWQQWSVALAALGSWLMEQAQAALLQQATKYCVSITDWATHSVTDELAELQQQVSTVGKSLLLVGLATIPASQVFCTALLTELQAQVKALLEGMQLAWSGDARPDSRALELPASALPALGDAQALLPAAWPHDMLPASWDVDAPLPEPERSADQTVSVGLVGDWDTAGLAPLT